MPIGKLESVELRELWKHEERGFSAWLADNMEALSEAIDVQLLGPEREVTIGSFKVDIVATDEEGNRVIIENQLEQTDHDHLGKLITYLTNLDAKIAVWITKYARPEHRRSVAWLNETTPGDIKFFLVQLAAFRIGNSDLAPLFTVVEGPSRDSKAIGSKKKELAENDALYHAFWRTLLERAKSNGVNWHGAVSPKPYYCIGTGAGRSGLKFWYLIFSDDGSAIELYINTRDKAANKAIFDLLFAKRDEIERTIGDAADWRRLDEKQSSRILLTLKTSGLNTGEENWPTIQDAMIDAMDRFVKAFKPHIAALP